MRQFAFIAAIVLGAASLPRADAPAVFFAPAADVKDAFVKGRPLTETAGYKVHASRREAPGLVEIHEVDTDIVYVLEGHATLVTGGAMTGGRTIAPNEIRGERVTGGEARSLAPGDVVIVPNGVPHWFTQVENPFLYYVVKVTDRGGAR